MQEIVPGVYHWSAKHPRLDFDVHSYLLPEVGLLFDPVVPAEGLDALPGTPRHVFLTNRRHFREASAFRERFDCKVWCVEQGGHAFTHADRVHPFRWGDDLPGPLEAIEIGGICPDETAYHVAHGDGLLAVADGVVREGEGPVAFVPDELMGEDPEAVKRSLRTAYGRAAREREFDTLLMAHGLPWVGGAREALRRFTDSDPGNRRD